MFGLYSLCVTVYLLSRFSLSLLYRPTRRGPDQLPTVAVVIPAMNEQAAIETTLASIFALDYPQHLLSVFAVDDGSTDATWERMAFAARRFPNLHAIRFSHNRGKRAAMAAGIRATDAQIVCFVDSDSTLEPDALREIIKPFRDNRVAAVTGHADVQNRAYNVLTLLQQVRYFVAFRVIKGSESIFGAVTCASGCFSAYRRDRLLEVLPAWETQSFLGREATFGDDRALTNMLLKRSRVVYQSTARCATNVPHKFKGFLDPADALEEELAARVADRLDVLLEEEPDRVDPDLRLEHLPDRRADRDLPRLHLEPDHARRRSVDVPRRPLRDGRALQPLLRLHAPQAVLVGRHRLRAAVRDRADLADLLGDRDGPQDGLGHALRTGRRRARVPHHRHDRLAPALRHPALRRGRAHRRGRGQRARSGRVIERQLPFNLVGGVLAWVVGILMIPLTALPFVAYAHYSRRAA